MIHVDRPSGLRRRALLIGIENYADDRFFPLRSVQADVWQMNEVLSHPRIGGFQQPRVVLDCTADRMVHEIGEFLDDCDEHDLAVLYVSGHGTRLIQDNGQFYFVATDTDLDRVATTGVGAEFVNSQLESCLAAQKVLMIDCCRSGGFTMGFRTSDAPIKSEAVGADIPITSRGVYVLASSRAGEDSLAGTTIPGGGFAPSAFTGEVVEALRTGVAARPDTREVTVDGLFEYVNTKMRRSADQVPVKSALGVDDRVVIATAPGRPPIIRAMPQPGLLPVKHVAVEDSRPIAPTWTALLEYYRSCLRVEDSTFPMLSVGDEGTTFVCLRGTERFISAAVDPDHRVPVPTEAAALVGAAVEAGDELWAGYPAVVVQQRGSRRIRHRFAPLLIRRVEVVASGERLQLEPTGPVLAHPKLIEEFLGEGTADHFNSTLRPSWHAGQHDRMANEITYLLANELEVSECDPIRPAELLDHIDVDTPIDGARNVAVLVRVPAMSGPTINLLKDLRDIEARQDRIAGTALAALSPDSRQRAARGDQFPTYTKVTPLPCNESQEAVLDAAMTRRLTVATGPPGTGKTQLVTNLIATAIANNQSVLVASTNNRAVDEVVDRCRKISPGSIIRTGSREYQPIEAAALVEILGLPEPLNTVDTVAAAMRRASANLDSERDVMRNRGELERELLELGSRRKTHAQALNRGVEAILAGVGTHNVESLTGNGLFARRRRRKVWSQLGTAEEPADFSEFLRCEAAWRRARAALRELPGEDLSITGYRTAGDVVRAAATGLLDTVVRGRAHLGKRAIAEVVNDIESRYSWSSFEALRPYVAAWAVSSLSARRFPCRPAQFDLVIVDEASQCAIPHILPLLFRARRTLIIGDPMQLTHIAQIDRERDVALARAAGVSPSWLEQSRLSYRRHSSFRAAERAVDGHFFIDEHFRCHPRIAELVNRLFYGGRLTVLTDSRRQSALRDRNQPARKRDAIIWAEVAGTAEQPPGGKSWINTAEVDRVVESVTYMRTHGVLAEGASIGVVTPFKAQADLIESRLRPEMLDKVRVGTVHTFQGGECDVMIFSLVAAPGMRAGSVAWLDGQLNMWNVAITRARANLVVIGHRSFCEKTRIGSALLDAAAGAGSGSASTELHDLLYKRLNDILGVSPELGVEVSGHLTDAVVDRGGRTFAAVLDAGAASAEFADRQVRLSIDRRDLRVGPEAVDCAVRVPAWRLFEEDHAWFRAAFAV
ncbi:caspase, EACC1-associated type [Nocardia tengchongensis]|uniref:caspase, EACC1-associated type n=1 Tax=Nocardia tengchongensis TaxID=2055889 RepID=UPI0036C7C804